MGVLDAVRDDTGLNGYRTGGPEPAIAPGQVWLVECDTAALSAFHAGLLKRANVVLYQRSLGAALAEALPLGVYAEKLPEVGAAGTGAAEPALAPRALHFAAEGWRVVQLVERGALHRRLRPAVGAPDGAGASPLLAIGAIAAGRYRPLASGQRPAAGTDLTSTLAELRSDELLGLIFAAPGVPPVARPPLSGQAFTANGLAG